MERQPDATPLGFFERISTCDVSLRKRQRQMPDRAMASSDPTPSPPLILLPAPALEAMPKPRPTVVDNVLGMLRSGQAFLRGTFRCNSGHAAPPRQTTSPQGQQHQPQHHNRPVRPSQQHYHQIVLACLTGISFGCRVKS